MRGGKKLNEILKNAANCFSVGQAIEYHEHLGIAVEVNDGKDVTLEIEKPPAGKHEGQM